MTKNNMQRFSVLMIPLLLGMFSIAPLAVIYASTGQQQRVPGMPDDALQFDRTDITPVGYREQITANKMHIFAYKNVTLMMNCSRNSEFNITIDPRIQTRYLALVMEQNQACLLHMNISGSLPPGVQTMQQTLNCYWGIEPNATLQLQVQLRVHINGTTLNQELNREVDTSRLTWMYWDKNGESWIPVESSLDEDGYLVCETTHLSTWTVAELMESTVQWTTYIMISGVAFVAVAGGVILMKRRR